MPDRRISTLTLHLATAPLAALLLVQGAWVRWRVPRLPEPPGDRHGVAGAGLPLRLLLLGDSAAAGVGAASQAEALSGQLVEQLGTQWSLDWRLLAHTGHRASDALRALQAQPGIRCDVVLTSLGVNDATALASPQRFAADMRALIGHLQEHSGARLILLSGLPPIGQFPALPQPLRWRLGRQAKRLDAVLQMLASEHAGCEHLPFGDLPDPRMMASDGFHPGPAIYTLWAATAAQRISAGEAATTAASA